jgi:hypothetical protein
MFVVLGDEVIDFRYQVFDAGEGAASNRLVSDERKEALDLVEPAIIMPRINGTGH